MSDPPENNRPVRLRAVRAAIWSVSQNGARELFAFVTFVVLARWFLEASDFGIVALANSFVAFAGLFVSNGLIGALIQRPNIDDRHRTAAFWCGMLLGVLAAVLVSGLAWLFAAATDDRRLPYVLAALGCSLLPMSAAAVHEAELRRRLDFRAMTVRGLIAAALGSVSAIGAAMVGAGLWSLVVQSWVTAVASSAMLWLLVPWRPGWRMPLREARELLPMSVSLTGLALLNFSGRIVDRLVIGALLGVSELGFYYAAQRIIQSLQSSLSQGINGVALPAFSEAKGDISRARRGYTFAVHICATVTFPIFIGVALLSDRLIVMLFGPDWQSSGDILRFLALGAAPASILMFNQPLLVALGRPNQALWLASLGTLLIVPFDLAGSVWGILGISVAVAIRQWLMMISWFFVISRTLHLKGGTYIRLFWQPIAASAAMALAILMGSVLLGTGKLETVALILVGGAIYVGTTLLINRDLFKTCRHIILAGNLASRNA